MNCDCIQRIDEKLKEAHYNYRLAPSIVFDDRMQVEVRLSISTAWVGEPPRGKKTKQPPSILCTFCPFCGTKAEDKEVTNGQLRQE